MRLYGYLLTYIMEIQSNRVIPSLQIQTYGGLTKLTTGQASLLKTITQAISNNRSLTWDDIVNAYCKGVRRKYTGGYYREGIKNYLYEDIDIKQEYEKLSSCWVYSLRPLIKQWFLTTIGTLVIKNQLAVIPLIEIQ